MHNLVPGSRAKVAGKLSTFGAGASQVKRAALKVCAGVRMGRKPGRLTVWTKTVSPLYLPSEDQHIMYFEVQSLGHPPPPHFPCLGLL